MSEPHDLDELVALAEEAARAAGAILLHDAARPLTGLATKSTATDPVSDADLAAERAIRELVERHRPGDAVLGEEGGEERAEGAASGLRWVVDPLDGTANFIYRIPHWSVSIACEDEDGALAGVVYDPVREELFAAVRDGAATLNGAGVPGSACADLGRAMVATGFAYDAAVRARQGEVVAAVLPRVRDVRRLGSAALDLAWTACGRYDAYFERGVNRWDVEAGLLLCERAGLGHRVLPGEPGLPWGVLVAPPALLDELGALVA